MEKPSKLKLFILDLFPPLPSHTAGLLSCADRCHPKVCSGVWCCPFLEEREFRFAKGVFHTEAVLGMPPLALGIFSFLYISLTAISEWFLRGSGWHMDNTKSFLRARSGSQHHRCCIHLRWSEFLRLHFTATLVCLHCYFGLNS